MSPKGFLASGWNVGIKDDSLDFGVVFSREPAHAAAVFTKNNFPGNPVIVGREHIKSGRLQAIVVNSKNANVATGPDGLQAARNTCAWAGKALGIAPELVLPSSTGVIGRPMPVEKIQAACGAIPDRLTTGDFELFSKAIMTTDTFPKLKTESLSSGIVLTGCAKGAGMIAPDMATMLSYVCTDADMDSKDLDRLVRCVADRTFNRVSIDSDTSTSDTFVCLANGASGVRVSFPASAAAHWEASTEPVPADLPGLDNVSKEFALTLGRICLFLTREI
ncbi:MAG: bifunctional ornithine acetyltransferase/N-acetylglutamate synthase, partial [Spirochaetia bacterium]|nr:bifunctional ornithine acetyltransferase/N-acetylglutamate synthase [Spirochaetia bacterium]